MGILPLLACYVLLISFVTRSRASRPCPVPCAYIPASERCSCTSSYWTRIPHLSQEIRILRMTECHIMHLQAMSFSTAPNLTSLALVKCGIQSIDKDAFRGLSLLKHLSLAGNKLTYLANDSMADLGELLSLSLLGNLFQVMPTGAICTLRNLQQLNLSKNKLNGYFFEDCFDNLENLFDLILNGNVLSSVTNKTFKGMCNLKVSTLDIASSRIREVAQDSFNCLTHLRQLSMNKNDIRHIGRNLFRNLHNLTSLYILDSFSVAFNSQTLTPLSRLQELSTGDRRWKTFVFGSSFLNFYWLHTLVIGQVRETFLKNDTFRFLVACPIKSLCIRHCGPQNVEPGWLSFFPNLATLQLEEIRFSVSFQDTFADVKSPNLTWVNLHSVAFSGIDNIGESFNKTCLERLTFTNSGITKLNKTMIGKMANLKKLDLSNNKITHIERLSFQHLPSLERLILDRNRLTQCHSGEWLGLGPTLKTLILKINGIQKIGGDSMRGYTALETLDLSRNALTTFLDKPFHDSPSLRSINMNHNRIRSLRDIGLPQSLQTLHLEHNELQMITTSALKNLTNLEILKLSFNLNLASNRNWKDAIMNLVSLRTLSITAIGLSEIPSNLFSNLTHLEELSLGRNGISVLDPGAFNRLPLKSLSLLGNRITTIKEDMFISLADTLQEVFLSGNPFACTCDLLWFRNFITSSNVYFHDLQKEMSYVCASPDSLQNVPFLQFNISPYDCISKMELGAAFGVFFTCLTLGICGSLIFKYWWHLRYFWFQLQAHRKRQHEIQPQPRYRYDAFVCYHRDDLDWVIHQLLPNIEYDGGYRVCLHDRDWLGGIDIAENILVSIEMSRKVICVLTDDFAASQWCQFEVAMAQHRLLDEGRDVLIPVLMGEIQGRHLTARLRHLLHTKTYLAWPADGDKEAKFWKALRKALKPRHAPAQNAE